MRCIFCLEEREPSLEHIFPDAIGGLLTTTRVCKPCNDYLGAKVDKHLTEHMGVLMKRQALGIENRDRKTVGFERIFRDGVMADNPQQRVRLVQVPGEVGLQPQLLHSEKRIRTPEGAEIIEVTIDASQAKDIGKIIQRTRKREGLPPLGQSELDAAVAAATAQVRTVERPSVHYRMSADLREFQVAILKIVYELAWLWLGDAYLEDPQAALFRAKIRHGSEADIHGQIQIGLVAPFDQLWRDENEALIGMAGKAQSVISVGVRVFDVLSGMVVVSEQPERYPAFEGQFHLCDPQARTRRDSTLPGELARIIALANGRSPPVAQ